MPCVWGQHPPVVAAHAEGLEYDSQPHCNALEFGICVKLPTQTSFVELFDGKHLSVQIARSQPRTSRAR